MGNRVVVTGLGTLAPNGVGTADFLAGIKSGRSGIKFIKELKDLNFGCQIGGFPDLSVHPFTGILKNYGIPISTSALTFACLAAMEAWDDAGLNIPSPGNELVNYDAGIIISTGIGNSEIMAEKISPLLAAKLPKRLGGRTMEQVMISSPSAFLSGVFALGNQCLTISNACAGGIDAVIEGFERIKSGKAEKMLVGGTEGFSPYLFAPMDATRIPTRNYNDNPQAGCRPMSKTASGFVFGSGAGVLFLENLDSALQRGARIYCEITGGSTNSGGHRHGGSMTAYNPQGVVKCLVDAIEDAGITPDKIDAVSGHLTATKADPSEIALWKSVIKPYRNDFPYINALKGMTGHCFGASGALETIACALQIHNNFIHPSINCEDLHPDIEKEIGFQAIPFVCIDNFEVNYFANASFGFGDVNACVIMNKFNT